LPYFLLKGVATWVLTNVFLVSFTLKPTRELAMLPSHLVGFVFWFGTISTSQFGWRSASK